MSTSGEKLYTSASDPSVHDMTGEQLSLEREKLTLEREMLALERERMAAEREQWKQERELHGEVASGLHVGLGVFGIAIATALVVAGLIGFKSGLETGRFQAPPARHVVISREFMQLLDRTRPLPQPVTWLDPQPAFDWLALYSRPPETRYSGNLILIH